jgi:hypothetical protein
VRIRVRPSGHARLKRSIAAPRADSGQQLCQRASVKASDIRLSDLVIEINAKRLSHALASMRTTGGTALQRETPTRHACHRGRFRGSAVGVGKNQKGQTLARDFQNQ